MCICTSCGKMEAHENGIVIDGQFFCSDCFTTCSDCEETIILSENEHYTTADGRIICENCFESNYFTCEDCGNIYHIDDSNRAHDRNGYEVYVCSDCLNDNYFECDNCNEYYHNDSDHLADGYNNICSNCWDDYYTCVECGHIIHADDVYFLDDEPYCSDCFEVASPKSIKNYSYEPYISPKKTTTDKLFNIPDNKLLYFGLEVEVSGDREEADTYINYFEPDEQEIWLTEDSSIINGGFEITTQPMTYNYLTSEDFKSRFSKSFEYLQNQNFKGHNFGGIHIHISKNALTTEQRALLPLLIYSNDENSTNYKTLLKITQRKHDNIERWASALIDDELETAENKKALFEYCREYGEIVSERYTALNYNNYNTIEFRIFNSSIRPERIYKNIEFVKACIDYVQHLTALFIKDGVINNTIFNYTNLMDLLLYVKNCGNTYPNLNAFIEEKNITIPTYTTAI